MRGLIAAICYVLKHSTMLGHETSGNHSQGNRLKASAHVHAAAAMIWGVLKEKKKQKRMPVIKRRCKMQRKCKGKQKQMKIKQCDALEAKKVAATELQLQEWRI